ncbi:hypothetical protein A0J61_01597 [Choanephora cucurbitarum]|uniref:Uncharacterized protein n=1 Tax=Choanephora cucurbitarum TaxID=101091 RepID=A0A1C7NMF8_9FUNG|nr:hypothetical protein A0J61_01597 [Choanephora cucurbitarum]
MISKLTLFINTLKRTRSTKKKNQYWVDHAQEAFGGTAENMRVLLSTLTVSESHTEMSVSLFV